MSTPVGPRAAITIPPFLQPVLEQGAKDLLTLLLGFIGGLFRRAPKVLPIPPVAPPAAPGVPVPIAPTSSSTPLPGQVQRRVDKVTIKAQMVQAPPRVNLNQDGSNPLNLYPNPMKMIADGEAFHVGSHLWGDLTGWDENGDEWQGHSIIAAGKDYLTRHEVLKDGQVISWIQGEGDDNPTGPGEPKLHQLDAGGVSHKFRAWKDSRGMNDRMAFDEEGDFEIAGYFDGVRSSNTLKVRIR